MSDYCTIPGVRRFWSAEGSSGVESEYMVLVDRFTYVKYGEEWCMFFISILYECGVPVFISLYFL